MRISRVLTLAVLAAVAGCGRVADLQPAPGKSLPVKPMMARTTPTSRQLLDVPPYAKPERVDELMKRSEPRRHDPFDLPPPTGGSAPAVPAGGGPDNVTNETTPG